MWLGEYNAGDIVDFKFTTRGLSGQPFALANGGVACYKDNSTTESLTGVTLTVNFDNVSGCNHVRVTTASDSTFYSSGSDFQAIVCSGTVDSIPVYGEVVGHFTLRNRAAWIASGLLSGQLVNLLSGNQVQVWSGTQVNIFSGQLSGQQVAIVSGTRINTWDAMDVGTARSGVITSLIQLATTAPADSGGLVGERIDIVQGAAAGQSRIVVAYSGTGRWVLVDRDWTIAPDTTSIVAIRGTKANINSGHLSGQLVTAASGVFGTASLNSGQIVLIYSGQLSGQLVNLLSGNQVQVWSGTQVNIFSGQLSGSFVNIHSGQISGAFVNVHSGQLSGIFVNVHSGQLSGFFVNVQSGQLSGQIVTAASGVFGTASLNSGQIVLVYSGQLSGQLVNLLSGNIIEVNSGTAVNVFSGRVWLASGNIVEVNSGTAVNVFSGRVWLASGNIVEVLSGTSVNVFSGRVWLASGNIVEVHSGTSVNVFSGSLWLASGQRVLVYSGQLSGHPVSLLSGERAEIALTHLDMANGVESGLTVRQHHRGTAAACYNQSSGFIQSGITTVRYMDYQNVNQRIVANVDTFGNRSGITTSF